jgi:tRNA dimethylallyltransferase
MSQKTVIIIAGPTAVGKTAVAVDLARQLDTEIISADSRQCYRELRIGVARPSEEELAAVPHHFIASHSIFDNVSAATFEHYALQKAAEIFERKDVLVMTGGTGLYIRAFCEGLDPLPEIPEAIREHLRTSFREKGLTWLQEEVQRLDPEFYKNAEQQNPHRLIRALEIKTVTGHSILHFQKGNTAVRPFRIIKTAVQLPRENLYPRINQRVLNMMEEGLLEEVKALLPFRERQALQTVGYRELLDHLDGQCSLQEAINLIQRNTRHYAKRQETWFRKDQEFEWLGGIDDFRGAISDFRF